MRITFLIAAIVALQIAPVPFPAPTYDAGAVERVTAYVAGRVKFCDESDLARVPIALKNAAIDR